MAQNLRVSSIATDPGSGVTIRYSSSPGHYYVLLRGADVESVQEKAQAQLARDVVSEERFAEPGPLGGEAFYRILEVSRESPLDCDGDGIHDVYELEHDRLDPLDPGDAGLDPDGNGLSFLDEFLQQGGNHAPTLAEIPTQFAVESSLWSLPTREWNLVEDPDVGDTLHFELLQKPAGMTVDAGTGTLEWTPTAAQVGNHPVSLQVRDTAGATAARTFQVEVENRFNYLVGQGMHDITGPAAENGMMGYADDAQKTTGIHDRQWARAFIVVDRKDTGQRVAFVTVEAGQMFPSVAQGVLDLVAQDVNLRNHYSHGNVVLSATHTHGACGGHSYHTLFNASIGGFSWQNYKAMVNGIYQAIKEAHNNLQPGRVLMTSGQLDNASKNRRPAAFDQNLEVKRGDLENPFQHSHRRDTEMLVLRFEDSTGRPIGMLNWFAVHGVSFPKENTLLTSDNKGYAAFEFERLMGSRHAAASDFVAAFANSNEGDVTANLRDSVEGINLDDVYEWQETLNIQGKDAERDWESKSGAVRAVTIGERQRARAQELFAAADLRPLKGRVGWRSVNVDFRHLDVTPRAAIPYNRIADEKELPFATPEFRLREWLAEDDFLTAYPIAGEFINPNRTCPGALGFEFAKGTLDGKGKEEWMIDALNAVLTLSPDATRILEVCHQPKQIILSTALGIDQWQPVTALPGPFAPTTWAPQILPLSILKVGDLAILSVPAEFTAMAGWRLRQTVESELEPGVRTIVAGLSDAYAGYVTTFEEYAYLDDGYQTYEGASTHFGPFTLVAYQEQFAGMAASIRQDRPHPSPLPVPEYRLPAAPPVDPTTVRIDPVEDPLPPPQRRAAVYKGEGGCPEGQRLDVLSGICYRCPVGYVSTAAPKFDVFTGEATANGCEIPAREEFTAGVRYGDAGCPSGQFPDLLTQRCWSCPPGYQRSAFPIQGLDGNPTPNGCHRPASSAFEGAQSVAATQVCTVPNPFGGCLVYGWKCPDGQGYTLEGQTCYRCPSGSTKLVFEAWSSARACERVTPEDWKPAARHAAPVSCPGGQVAEDGGCWACPAGYGKAFNFTSYADPKACVRVIPAVPAKAIRGPNFLCEDRGEGWFGDPATDACWSCEGWRKVLLASVGTPENPAPDACESPTRPGFGTLLKDVPAGRMSAGSSVEAQFWAGHPKNVFGTIFEPWTSRVDSFMEVQRLPRNAPESQWTQAEVVARDADWSTEFRWSRQEGASVATVRWIIPKVDAAGNPIRHADYKYRILHKGYSKPALQVPVPYANATRVFEISDN
ncbi:MAG: neutral/alkaline non-lysosomal ceramidase N-terminal domain-containing protein [Verrucomicrobiales bacterium]|nr:neutral/alkaline non-lysosomal ceramidase N-terminal domain-containing protein [Verrucomicrobiales bacterium]